MVKQNCWDFKRCGRQAGGPGITEMGVCPAATDERLNGVNGGINCGRACWVVAGTLCGGKSQGTYAAKMDTCLSCEFYKRVYEDERTAFVMTAALFQRLRAGSPVDK